MNSWGSSNRSDVEQLFGRTKRALTMRTMTLAAVLLLIASTAVAQTPTITSVSKVFAQDQFQTITITGTNFGTLAPYTGDSDFLSYNDDTTGIQCGYTPDGNVCGLIVNSWTDTQIVLGGFSLSNPAWLPNVSNKVFFTVWNPQSGVASKAKKAAIIAQKTETTLTSSANPSTEGEEVTFTAEVATSAGGTPPDGESVSFLDGTTVIGTGTLSGGSATFNISTLAVGTASVKAVYGGDGKTITGSKSKPLKQVVKQ
jgi:hypothetical protein